MRDDLHRPDRRHRRVDDRRDKVRVVPQRVARVHEEVPAKLDPAAHEVALLPQVPEHAALGAVVQVHGARPDPCRPCVCERRVRAPIRVVPGQRGRARGDGHRVCRGGAGAGRGWLLFCGRRRRSWGLCFARV